MTSLRHDLFQREKTFKKLMIREKNVSSAKKSAPLRENSLQNFFVRVWYRVSFFHRTYRRIFSRSDIYLGIQHLKNGDRYWGLTTLSIVFFSGFFTAYFSLLKSKSGKEKRKSPIAIILHILLLGPMLHFWELLKNPINPQAGLEKDVLTIQVLEGILEAAPQVWKTKRFFLASSFLARFTSLDIY